MNKLAEWCRVKLIALGHDPVVVGKLTDSAAIDWLAALNNPLPDDDYDGC